MNAKPSRRFLATLAATAGVAGLIALFCCGPAAERPSATANDERAPDAQNAAPPGALVEAKPRAASAAAVREDDAGATPGAPDDAPGAPDDTVTAQRNPIAVAASRDPRDLELLSRIERELGRDPPEVVHALLALRERGATQDQLVEFVRERFPADLALRAAAMRWIDQVSSGSVSAPKAPDTAGSGPSLVKPLEKAP